MGKKIISFILGSILITSLFINSIEDVSFANNEDAKHLLIRTNDDIKKAEEELECSIDDLGYDNETILVKYSGNENKLKKEAEKLDGIVSNTIFEFEDGEKVAIIKKSNNTSTEKAIEEYENLKIVKEADRNLIFKIDDTPEYSEYNDSSISQQYYLNKDNGSNIRGANVYAAWNFLKGKERNKVRVAVIDSGCDLNHPDLKNVINKDLCAEITATKVQDDTNQSGESNIIYATNKLLGDGVGVEDTKNRESGEFYAPGSHGTHVAGIIAAEANNAIGIAGVGSCGDNGIIELIPIDVLENGGSGSIGYIVCGLEYARKCECSVINISLGAKKNDSDEETIIFDEIMREMYNYNITTVASAGNTMKSYDENGKLIEKDSIGKYDLCVPGCLETTIGVINTMKDGNVADSSCRGLSYDICAPGTSIYSTISSGKYQSKTGTSMASPVVAGIVGLLYGINIDLKPSEVKDILCSTATDLYESGADKESGYGLINAEEAVISTWNYYRPNVKSREFNLPRDFEVTFLDKDGKVIDEFTHKVRNKSEIIMPSDDKMEIKGYIFKGFDNKDYLGEILTEDIQFVSIYEEITTTLCYRLYNPNTGEHLITGKLKEYNKLGDLGWEQEGAAFDGYSKEDKPSGAIAVYRLYNPNGLNGNGDHHYTSKIGERDKLIKNGWILDNNGEPNFYVEGECPVYRLYNSLSGAHHYTPKKSEYEKLTKIGWIEEKIGWYVISYYVNGERVTN